jgi:SAM-dependent methyltransferase
MQGSFAAEAISDLVLPGRVSDYLDTPVLVPENLALLAQRDVLLAAMRDDAGLPTTDAREGYFGERHLEYWLSGYRDALPAIDAAHLSNKPGARVLDFGGASGRVIRHMRYLCASPELYVAEINPRHVQLLRGLFEGSVHAVHNYGTPHLPFPDRFFDCVTAYSVFTHMYDDDTAWLLELRRIVKPGGIVYITIHDDETWRRLPSLPVGELTFSNPEFKQYYDDHPELPCKTAHFYSERQDYNCNVFVPKEYVQRFWQPLFAACEITSVAHDYQAGVAFTCPPH